MNMQTLKLAGLVAQVVECLTSKCDALNSNYSTALPPKYIYGHSKMKYIGINVTKHVRLVCEKLQIADE
jgi:hypothetical protein